MDIRTITTSEKLRQAIVNFLESDYSQEDLVKTYDDARKCVSRFRGDYPALPDLPPHKDNPLDGLQDVMKWCDKSSMVIDEIVFNLDPQTIREVIRQLKKLREIPSRLLSLINSNLLKQAQNEVKAMEQEAALDEQKQARADAEKTSLKETGFLAQSRQAAEEELKNLQIGYYGTTKAESAKNIVQIYLSRDPGFDDRFSQMKDEFNEAIKTLNKLLDNSPTGKCLDIYCKLKDIPLQQQCKDIAYAYSHIDLADVIFGDGNRFYASIDNLIRTFQEIQTNAEQSKVQADLASEPINMEDYSARKKTGIFDKVFFNNFIKATIKHLPYVGPYLFDVIYGVDGVKAQKKEETDLENKKLTRKEHNQPYIKAGRDIIAGGDIIVGNENIKDTPTTIININKLGVWGDIQQVETLQTGDNASTHKQVGGEEKKKGIFRRIPYWIYLLVSFLAALLAIFHYMGWLVPNK